MRFRYKERVVDPLPGESSPQVVYDPVIVVRVAGPLDAWLIPGLLDTGADETLLPMRFLALLGIPRGDRFDLTGVSGTRFPAWLGSVDMELARGGTICQWSARVGFSPTRRRAI